MCLNVEMFFEALAVGAAGGAILAALLVWWESIQDLRARRDYWDYFKEVKKMNKDGIGGA